MTSFVKGGIEIKTDHHIHSKKRSRIEDSPVCSDDVDEIETQKLAPRHSGKRPRLEDTTVRSDDEDRKQIETHKGEVGKTTNRKSVKQKLPACPKCRRRRDRARARNEKPPLPKGYGYLTVSSGVDKDGHYHELRGDRAYYMSCLRCGMEGDHWDPYCPNPINDPPESEESGAACLTWKYILRDFNPKPQIDKEIETQGPISPDRESMMSFVKGGIKIETETHHHSGEHPHTVIRSDDDHKQIETHKGGIEIERHRIDDNTSRGFKHPHLEDTICSDDLLAVDDKEIETHKGGVEIKTDHHSHSCKRPCIENSPVWSDDVDEIKTQKLEPRHSGKHPCLEDTTVRSDDDDHKQIETHKGEVGKTTNRMSVKQRAPACPKCHRRRDRARARNEKPPLPKGYGYLTVSSGVDKDGHYHELRGDRAYYMSCLRCGMEGDHWDPYCPNPINDPPEEESGVVCLTWKYILRDFNPKSH